jgi:hypothetical protein
MYNEFIDRLTLFFTADRFKTELALAKKGFFDESGVMDEENQSFEMRMTQFLEWYLFSRNLAGRNVTPAEYALELEEFEMTSEERPLFENLAATRHSLFEFLNVRGDDIHIRDLLLDKKLIIYNSPMRVGFNRDELFDARLIPYGENYHFARAFCFHPGEASSFIFAEVKKLRRAENMVENEAFMLRLLKMRYKYEQYRHLSLDHVYTNEKRLRF